MEDQLWSARLKLGRASEHLKVSDAAEDVIGVIHESRLRSGGAPRCHCLLGGRSEHDIAPAELAAHQAKQADAWRLWRRVVASLLVLVMVEEDARKQLEARYLAEQPALLADSQADWDRFADLVDRLWSLAEKVAPVNVAEGDLAAIYSEEVLAERVAARVQRLADDTRVSTFERLGELPRAVAIIERRLRNGA